MGERADLTRGINYQFSRQDLLSLALTHPSMGQHNNQRLEFLGDAVLELCVSDLLFRLHPQLPEGDLTRLRAALVCEDSLYRIARDLKLEKHIKARPPVNKVVTGRKSILADTVEAILAAVYLDGGFAAAQMVVDHLWLSRASQADLPQNSKNRLQEHFAAEGSAEPQYETVAEEGPAHKRLFTVTVSQEGRELARAQGLSKKAAEQAAAEKALLQLTSGEDLHEA